ncbi:MAG: hypothetical protein AABM40_12890 [Chloroflexota bacterium]
MPGKRLALTLAIAAWSTSCSTPPSLASPVPHATDVPIATAAVKSIDVCIALPPQTWTAGFQSHSTVLPAGTRFGLGAPTISGQVAFGQFDTQSGSGIGSVDLTSGRMTRIATWDTQMSGMGWMAVELPWVVWEQGNSPANSSDWTVLAWNKDTGVTTTIATSLLPDGSFLFGQPPLPAIRHGIAVWAQPLPKRSDHNEAEIHVRELARGADTVIATGRVGAPIFAGRYLIWAQRDVAGSYSFQSVDADTLQPANLPARLRDPGPIVYVAGSSRYLAWSGDDSLEATVWAIDSGEFAKYRSPDLSHSFQFMQLADHYLLYYGGTSSTVLDLATGNGFDVAGSLAGSDQVIAKEEPSAPATQKAQVISSRISSVSLSAVGAIAPCTRR